MNLAIVFIYHPSALIKYGYWRGWAKIQLRIIKLLKFRSCNCYLEISAKAVFVSFVNDKFCKTKTFAIRTLHLPVSAKGNNEKCLLKHPDPNFNKIKIHEKF